MTGDHNKKTAKCYHPDRSIISLITDLLQYKSDVEDKEIVNRNRKRYLDKEKVKVLDQYIFPSMANLTFFFKSISRYPQLKEVFDNDIMDLLGIRREDPRQQEYGFILSQLLRSILLVEIYNDEDEDEETIRFPYQLASADIRDFRLRLNQVLQEIVGSKVVAHLTKTDENEKAWHIVEDDFDRVRLWTRILAEGVNQTAEEEDNARPRRTIKFGSTPLREDEDPI